MPRYHVRCANAKCRKRRVLRKHPFNYKYLPACNGCRRRKYHIDKYMNTRDTSPCNCGAYSFPHRHGSLKCLYRSDKSFRGNCQHLPIGWTGDVICELCGLWLYYEEPLDDDPPIHKYRARIIDFAPAKDADDCPF